MAVDHPAYGDGVYRPEPRRRWGRRLLISLLVALLVLIGLLVVADRVAAGVAERAIAEQVSQEAGRREIRSEPPEVTVGGFPFLTQVLAGRYESISILVRDIRTPGELEGLRMPVLEVDARNVTASIDTIRTGQGEVVAETVEGTGTIGYDNVVNFIDQPGLTLREEEGQLRVRAPLTVLGQEVTVQGTAKLSISDGEVFVGFDELTAEGMPDSELAEQALIAYARQISVRLPVPAMPFDLRVREVHALPEGLSVTATAQDVPLNAVT